MDTVARLPASERARRCIIAPADFISLNNTQWRPSAGSAIYLAAGEYEVTPMLNPNAQGVSAFFSGGGWNSWSWNWSLP